MTPPSIDESGNTIDFYLSYRRNAKAAKRFLKNSLKITPPAIFLLLIPKKSSL
ncbi:DDE-type integrase/transposase/recombinase [Legionella sp. CNM-1927-20]|uniref:DDE-type integrase/transposase/recombinase n=1 Tax=Legionella sp. CNM-1927-20 TaxID=3422221 RepID=UPI00403B3831